MHSSPSSKKRKVHETDSTPHTIQDLEKQLTAAVSEGHSLNPLADLLAAALEPDNAAHCHKALYSLYRVFVIITSRDLLSGPDRTTEAKAVRTWLLEKFHAYTELLTRVLHGEKFHLKVCA